METKLNNLFVFFCLSLHRHLFKNISFWMPAFYVYVLPFSPQLVVSFFCFFLGRKRAICVILLSNLYSLSVKSIIFIQVRKLYKLAVDLFWSLTIYSCLKNVKSQIMHFQPSEPHSPTIPSRWSLQHQPSCQTCLITTVTITTIITAMPTTTIEPQ